MLARDATDGYSHLGVARVVERRADNRVLLDAQLRAAAAARCRRSRCSTAGCANCTACCTSAAKRWPGAWRSPGRAGVGEIADFLLLQTGNRYEPLFAHLRGADAAPASGCIDAALALAGELATFRDSKRAAGVSRPTTTTTWRRASGR